MVPISRPPSAFGPSSSVLAAEMLEQAGVALVPGEDFGHHEPQRYLRLS
jgi:aspartate/methionine/tyrosine aminotransferase